MSYAAKIIEKFDGTRAMAAALELPPSTVQSWKETGLIPAKHQQKVLDTAREKNIEIGPADFFDRHEPECQAEQGSAVP